LRRRRGPAEGAEVPSSEVLRHLRHPTGPDDDCSMRQILIVFGSKRGGTAGLAATIGEALPYDAILLPAKEVRGAHVRR